MSELGFRERRSISLRSSEGRLAEDDGQNVGAEPAASKEEAPETGGTRGFFGFRWGEPVMERETITVAVIAQRDA